MKLKKSTTKKLNRNTRKVKNSNFKKRRFVGRLNRAVNNALDEQNTANSNGEIMLFKSDDDLIEKALETVKTYCNLVSQNSVE